MIKIGKKIILEFIEEGFFDEWRTMNEVVKRLSQRGFTVSGRKTGNIGQTLTRLCRERKIGIERDNVPEQQIKEVGGKWKYKKVK